MQNFRIPPLYTPAGMGKGSVRLEKCTMFLGLLFHEANLGRVSVLAALGSAVPKCYEHLRSIWPKWM